MRVRVEDLLEERLVLLRETLAVALVDEVSFEVCRVSTKRLAAE